MFAVSCVMRFQHTRQSGMTIIRFRNEGDSNLPQLTFGTGRLITADSAGADAVPSDGCGVRVQDADTSKTLSFCFRKPQGSLQNGPVHQIAYRGPLPGQAVYFDGCAKYSAGQTSIMVDGHEPRDAGRTGADPAIILKRPGADESSAVKASS